MSMKSMMMMPQGLRQSQLRAMATDASEVGPEDRLFEIPVANVGAGVDIDGRHRLGLINHQ